MARVYQGGSFGLDRILGPVERLIYRICGIRQDEEMVWRSYAAAVLWFSLFGFIFLYLLQRLQSFLPLNPQGLPAVSSDSSFNTAVSFVTNTNWQGSTRNPDVILLDLGLPDMDGLEVIQRIYVNGAKCLVIVLSAREQEQDKVRALDAGADDYLTKPFGAGELLARIRAAMRRTAMQRSGEKESVVVLGNLRIDLVKRQVCLDDTEIHLTPLEYKLLSVLIKYAGKVVTHTQYLRIYMAQLRRKLEADPARPRFLINEPGIGYRLRLEVREKDTSS